MTFAQHESRRRKDGLFKIDGVLCQQVITGGLMVRVSFKERNRSGEFSTYPMTCQATGVLPKQIAEARAHDAENGLNIEYNSEGDAIYTCRSQRKRHCRSLGMYDRNG